MSAFFDNAAPRPRASKPVRPTLFDAPDQWRVRAELETFFGPRAETFLAIYERMRASPRNRRTGIRTWSWPVFLGSFTWFFYRKMYAYGAMLIFLPVIFGYLFGSVGSVLPFVFAMSAKVWYVRYALGRIAKADELGLTGAERTDYLQRAGGVSLPAGIFAGLIYGFMLAVVILGIAARHKTGQP
jgi:hypothetical protein